MELKKKVLLLALQFSKWPDSYVGILLPSSTICQILILSLQFAGKTPVMLNWTAGERALSLAKKRLGLKVVLTSRRFVDRASTLDLGEIEESLQFLEEIKENISLFTWIKASFLSLRNKAYVMKRFSLEQMKEEAHAVVLFTSGTEREPKAVPLSHKNLLSNQRGALASVMLERSDILYGVLPPFHSFGFSVTGLLPLLSGLRVFYGVDPTDAHQIAEDCDEQKVTLLCLAPSFYAPLFKIGAAKKLHSVRLFVSGAEKASAELKGEVELLGKKKVFLEGYGITECAPIVTLGRRGASQKGVGYPLSNIDLMICHPETGERLSPHEKGEVCIAGPNVFDGYLGGDEQDPFLEVEGKRWYRSGDLGYLAQDGALILEGRLKRFVKIGGEMVSLRAVEETLIQFALEERLISSDEKGATLALCSIERKKPLLILLTTFPIEKERINQVLREKGFGRIVKVSATYQVQTIPLTGSGKVQLSLVARMAQEKYGQDLQH